MPASMHITSGGHVSQFAYLVNRYPKIAEMLDKDVSLLNNAMLELLLENDTKIIQYLKQYTEQEKMSIAIGEGRKFIYNTKKYGFSDWYGWSNHNWGTKWGAYDGEMEFGSDGLHAGFNSAWSPPTPVIEELAKLYPEVRIRHAYLDEGYNYGGITYYADGEITSEDNADDVSQFAQDEFGHMPLEKEEDE